MAALVSLALLMLAGLGLSAAFPGGPFPGAAMAGPPHAGSAWATSPLAAVAPAVAPAGSTAPEGVSAAQAAATPGLDPMPLPTTVPTREARGFVALGDSLTAWAWDPGRRPGSAGTWPSVLESLDPELVLIHNSGVPGDRTSEMVRRFGRDVLAYRPDVLFILGGTNDVGDRRPASATIGYLRSIVRSAQSQGIEVVLLTVPPSNQLHAAQRRLLRDTNAAIVGLASQEGVAVVDVYSALATSTGGLAKQYAASDGLHLNRRGEALIAQTIYAAMHPTSPLEYWQR